MGLRFRKSIKLAPGVKLNVGKKSVGVSVGGKYGGVSFNSKSGARARVSAPGTGLSYSTKIGGSSKSGKKSSSSASTQVEVNAKTYWYLTLFLGWLGIHRFYRKQIGMGIFYLCTMGGFMFGWIYDIVVAYKMIKELNSNNEDCE